MNFLSGPTNLLVLIVEHLLTKLRKAKMGSWHSKRSKIRLVESNFMTAQFVQLWSVFRATTVLLNFLRHARVDAVSGQTVSLRCASLSATKLALFSIGLTMYGPNALLKLSNAGYTWTLVRTLTIHQSFMNVGGAKSFPTWSHFQMLKSSIQLRDIFWARQRTGWDETKSLKCGWLTNWSHLGLIFFQFFHLVR